MYLRLSIGAVWLLYGAWEPILLYVLRDCISLGWSWVKPAIKGAGSINAGISLLKEFDIVCSSESNNLRTEYLSYYWQELKDGTIINKPIDRMNHLMDALRYAVYSEHSNKNKFFVI